MNGKFLIVVGFFLGAGSEAQTTQQESISKEEVGMESVQAFHGKLVGDWTGLYSLWTHPGAEAEESDIGAHLQPMADAHYLLMTYTWSQGGKAQEGVFLMSGEGETVTATWGDSWHMSPRPMLCSGALEDGGNKLVYMGTYEAGDGPPWGWRTEFTLQGTDAFLMEAYNITPDGREALAVQAKLRRMSER